MLLLAGEPPELVCQQQHSNRLTLLHTAAGAGQTEAAALLLHIAPEAATTYNHAGTPLTGAIKNGCPSVVRLLLQAATQAATVDSSSMYNPLRLAAAYGHASMVEVLLKTAPELAARPEDAVCALSSAACGGHIGVMRAIMTAAPHAAAVIPRHVTAMHGAAEGGSIVAVQLLLQAAPETAGSTSRRNNTPAHLAAARGHSAALQLLLAAAPESAEVADDEGNIPLHNAARGGHAAAVEVLLSAASNTATTRTSSYSGSQTPLQLAAASRSDTAPTAVQLLLQAAPQTAVLGDARCNWPLHVAQHPQSAQLLLAAAPEAATRPNGDGLVPLQRALGSQRDSVACICLKAGQPSPVLAELSAVQRARPWSVGPLFGAFVAAFLPLSNDVWARIPVPLPEAAQALPAALACSMEQVRQVVQRLSASDRHRLQLFALCLARLQRRLRTLLPGPLVGRFLSFTFVA